MKLKRDRHNSQEVSDIQTTALKTLTEQYRTAVELYKHEDNLNWTKLNHLFYINAGLWAILGLIVKTNGTGGNSLPIDPHLLTVMVSVIGIVVCFAFEVALWFGIEYMQNRKDAVTRIEEKLVDCGGKYIVAPRPDTVKKKSFIEVSPTTWMLKLVPVVLLIVWVILFIKVML